MNGVLEVRFEKVYGRMVCYPVNEVAQVFAKIAGQTTLTPATVAGAQALGFEVKLAPESIETLERFVAGAA